METHRPGRFRFEDPFFGNPQISDLAFISETAVLIGDISIADHVMVSPFAIIRMDESGHGRMSCARIGKGVNIQEHACIHAHGGLFENDDDGSEKSVIICNHTSIAHGAKVHGPAYIGKMCFIGFDAILHWVRIGRNTLVDHGAIIKKSTIGSRCHIGMGARINNVDIADNRFVEDGQIIACKIQADRLPTVPPEIAEGDNEINKMVVDENKHLCALYEKRRKVITRNTRE